MQLPSIGHLFYRPQRSLAKVIFLQVCVCPQGGVGGVVGIPAACHAGQSWGGGLVPRGSPIFRGVGGDPQFWGGIFFSFLLSLGKHPPPPRSRVKHMVNERPVRILLECILVMTYYYRAGCHGLLAHTHPPPIRYFLGSFCVVRFKHFYRPLWPRLYFHRRLSFC